MIKKEIKKRKINLGLTILIPIISSIIVILFIQSTDIKFGFITSLGVAVQDGYGYGYGFDFGDAPTKDEGNHFNKNMTAYPAAGLPGVLANYPTVYTPPNEQYRGPCHNIMCFWLGNNISNDGYPDPSDDADQMPDDDNGFPNIDPEKNWPNMDWYDDGLIDPFNLTLINCTSSTFNFTVTDICGGQTKYFNAWFDWNRDGDWNDTLDCNGIPVPEWAVQNQEISGSGIFTSNSFLPYNPDIDNILMRMTLTPNETMESDGRGPDYCFDGGETEDYYITACIDRDGDGIDGSSKINCGPWDCNDTNTNVYPGALEVCDGVDNNCDGLVDETASECDDPSMVSYWTLNEGKGYNASDVVDGNNGTLTPGDNGSFNCTFPSNGCWAHSCTYVIDYFYPGINYWGCPPYAYPNWIYYYEASECGCPWSDALFCCAPCPPECEIVGTTDPPKWIEGRIGTALYFNGDGDYVTTGVTNIPANNASQTIALWYNVSSNPADAVLINIFNTSAHSALRIGFKNGNLSVWRWDGTVLVTAAPPAAGTWHHIAYTFNGSLHRLYVDGSEVDNSTAVPDSAIPETLLFAKFTMAGTSSYNGALDEIAIWNRSLSADEILKLYNIGNAGYCGTDSACPEFLLGGYDYCRNLIDDDGDTRPPIYGLQSSCVDNLYNKTFNATSITDLSGTDCWARYQVCGPCPAVENYTYDSCADGINNDYDTGTGNYLTDSTSGIDCADSDCLGELASYKGTRCVAAGQENNISLCTDGVDNDGDGNIDSADSDCPATTPDPYVNETTASYKLGRAFYNSNITALDTGDFNFTSSKSFNGNNDCLLHIFDKNKNELFNIGPFDGIINGNNITCRNSAVDITPIPFYSTDGKADGIYFLQISLNHSDGYIFNSSYKVFYVCNNLSSSGITPDGLKWDCAKADLDNDGWTEGLYTTLYSSLPTGVIPCDSCPGIVNTGLDSDGDGIDDACDALYESLKLEFPEGIYEPFCCDVGGIIYTGESAIEQGCDSSKNSNDDINCDTNEVLYGTHPHTFFIKFKNVTASAGWTAECIINKSNGTQFTISRTIYQNLNNENFVINHTISNVSFEEINRSRPWRIINCSIKDNSGNIKFFSNSSRIDYSVDYWKIYIDRNSWPLEGPGRQSTEAAFCYLQSTRENGYRDNAVTCDYAGDVQHAIDIKLGAIIPSAEECNGVNCSNYACRGITYLTCGGDRNANEYFTIHPWAVAQGYRILDSSFKAQAFGNCNANTNICTGTITSGSLATTYYYTYSSKPDGTLKVKFVNANGPISTASEMGNTIGQIDTTTVSSNSVGKYSYPSADAITLAIDNIEAYAYTTKQTGVSNKRVWQVMYINFTNSADPPASENFRTAIVWEGSAANVDNNPWVIDSNAPSNWNENDVKLWSDSNKYIYGGVGMAESQSNHRCNDRADNDLDWFTDCNDLDCNGVIIGYTKDASGALKDPIRCEHDGTEDFTHNGEVTCWDGYDNDHDNLVDCADPDCNNRIGAYYLGNIPVKYNTSSTNVAMCEYGSLAEGTIYYSSSPSSCNDTFNNDADAGNQWLNYACNPADLDECYNEATDCYDRFSCWGRSGTNTGICPKRENRTDLCQDLIDNDYDNRPIDPAEFTNWLGIYNPRAGSGAQNRTDCLDYDCYAITDGSGNYLCSASPTNIIEYNGSMDDDARRKCWDRIDNDLDWYYWDDSVNAPYGNYILNSSTGYDCQDPDCANVINPDNPAQRCLEQEFKLGFYDFCRIDGDDDFDSKPPQFGVGSSCVDNRLNDTASATSISDLSGTDCWAIYQVCGPCPTVENYTWESCADNIDNDYDDGAGNYDEFNSAGTNCADSDCLNELGSYKGAVCESSENSNLLCSDGFDNDANGAIDCADSNCNGFNGPDGQVCQPSESGSYCYDGYDNDRDGDVDCADSGCYSQPECVDINSMAAGTYCGVIPSIVSANPGNTGITYTHETREHINENYTISFGGDSGWSSATMTLGAASNPFPYSTSCVLSGNDASKFELTSVLGYTNIRIQSKVGADISSPWSITLNCPGHGTAGANLDYFLQINGLKSGQPKEGSATLSTLWFETMAPAVTKIVIGGNQSNVLRLKYGQSYTMLANATDILTGNNGICGCGFNISDPAEITAIQTSPKCRYTTTGQIRDIDNVQITARAQDGAYNFGPYESPLNFRLEITPIDTTPNYRLSRPFYNATNYTILDTGIFSFITGQGDSFSACTINILNGSKSLLQNLNANTNINANTISCSLTINLSNYINTNQDGIYFIYANTTDSDGDSINSSYKVFYVCNNLSSSGITPDGLKWDCAKADLDNDGWTEGLYTTLYSSLPTGVIPCDSCPPPIVNTGLDSDGDGIDDACDDLKSLVIWDSTDQICIDDKDCPGGYECKRGICIRENDNKRALIVKYTTDVIKFYANYTNETNGTITDATCRIYFDDLNAPMKFNSASNLYEYSRSFSREGTYKWNVTCAVSFWLNAANDTVTISQHIKPTPKLASRLTVCAEEWNCTDWGPCQPNGMQHRTCYDLNNCDELYNKRIVLHINRSLKPEEVRECVYEPKCYDGILNGNESDVDCGGLVCPKCENGKICRVDEDCINLCDKETLRCYTPIIIEKPLKIRPPLALIIAMALLILLILEMIMYRYQKEWIHRSIEHYKDRKAIVRRERAARVRLKEEKKAIESRIAQLEEERKAKLERLKEIEKERVLHEARKKEYTRLLNVFLTNAVNLGYSRRHIEQLLVSKGWPKKIVKEYCDEFFEKNKEQISEIKRAERLVRGEPTELIREIKEKESAAKKRLKELEDRLLKIDEELAAGK